MAKNRKGAAVGQPDERFADRPPDRPQVGRGSGRAGLIAGAAAGAFAVVLIAAIVLRPELFGGAGFPHKPRFAVILKTSDTATNFFWASVREGVDSAARDLKVDYEIIAVEKESDIDGQIRLAFAALETAPDAVILAASDMERLIPFAREVRRRGLPLVGMDSFLASDDAQARIGTDNLQAGAKLAVVAVDRVGKGAAVALMSYVAGSSTAIERERGFREASAGKLDIVETLYSESEQSIAYERTIDLLARRRDIRALVTLNLPTTLGAASALAGAVAKGAAAPMILLGFDNSMEVVEYIEDGLVAATVVQKPFNMGYLAMKAAYDLHRGRRTAAYIDTGSNVVDYGNLYSPENQRLLFPANTAP